jgi:predicted DsbA family dithiol-disulfide isomerase
VAKAAAALGEDAFQSVHDRLLHAYFAENRDISADETLRAIWRDAGLPDESFARREDPALLRSVIDDHDEAVALGVNGVPAVRLEDGDAAVLGAQPLEVYRRWFARSIAARR